MAASSPPPPSGNRPRPGWRYSLRALLIVVTLACVGVWIWYRVPYATEFRYPKHGNFHWREGSRSIYVDKEIQRFRRALYGKPIREGLTELFDEDGIRVGEEHWREGKRHGQWIHWDTKGEMISKGEYGLGLKQGDWKQRMDESGESMLWIQYDRDRPHGNWQWLVRGQVVRTTRLVHGEVIEIDGRAVDDPLGRALRLGQIDNERIEDMLEKPGDVNFVRAPLKDVAEFISETYKVNVALDKRALNDGGISEDFPINLKESHLNSGTMLVLLCDPHDLAATYRWGAIWITTKEDAKNWVDRTGMSDLLKTLPPGTSPRDRDVLRAALESPAQFDFIDTPLWEVAKFLSTTYRVSFVIGDDSVKDLPMTSSVRGVSLQNALGALCEHHSLRIRWTGGMTLVFEPQEGTDPIQARRAERK